MPTEITINEKIVRIAGSVNTDKNLELGDDVVMTIKGSVVKTEDWDNNDGTKDRVFKIKIMTAEFVGNEE